MNTETPLYDELEAKWNETCDDTRICDAYARITNLSTGQVWFEDDEGNEVFLEELEFRGEVHTVVREPNQTVIYNAEDAQFSKGGWIEHPKLDHLEVRDGMVRFKDSDCSEVQRLLENFDNDCPVGIMPKRKFKLFGRNQGTNGTL